MFVIVYIILMISTVLVLRYYFRRHPIEHELEPKTE